MGFLLLQRLNAPGETITRCGRRRSRDISSHIIFMDGGVIVEEGTPEQVINNPAAERTKAFLSRFNN